MPSSHRLPSWLGVFSLTVTSLLTAAPADEQNWPQWRGPQANGVAPAGDPPVTWSETSHLKWKVRLPGRGSATPIVWGNQVFIQTAIPTGKKVAVAPEPASPPPPPPKGDDGKKKGRAPGGGGLSTGRPSEVYQFVLLSLDRATGQTQWQTVLREEVPHEGHHPADGTFASASPVTDGQHVYAFFGSRGLHCVDLAGKVKWQKDFGTMRIRAGFGEGSSPTLYQDKLIINWDHEGDDFIAVLDKMTGRELWRQAREEDTSWSTPLVVTVDGRPQVVVTATRRIRSYDLATGRPLWECAGMTANVIPSPVAGQGLVYAISGFRGSALLALRPERTGDLTGTDGVVWSYKKNTPYVPSPLLYAGRLYFLAVNNAALTCCDAPTGRVLIDSAKLPELQGVYASPVGAAGRIYVVGRNGVTSVLKQADTLEVLATNRLDDKFDASPAIVGTEIFLRGREHLYCLTGK